MLDSGNEEDKTFHKLHVLGMIDDFWNRVHGLGGITAEVLDFFRLANAFYLAVEGSF